MQATTRLPAGYALRRAFTLKSSGAQILVTLAGVILLIAVFYGFSLAFNALRPGELAQGNAFRFNSLTEVVHAVLVGIVILFGQIFLHEAVHGAFFWIITRARPLFAFKVIYAYAAAPGWFIPRNPFIAAGLAPLVVISLVGILLAAFVPPVWLLPIFIVVVINGAGSTGDLWVALSLLGYPVDTYCSDTGDVITAYTRQAA